ncbi:MAG: efflux RND transporter periplasmic adaptor subunit [Prevotella sp.]
MKMIVVSACVTIMMSCGKPSAKIGAGNYKTLKIEKSGCTIDREYTATLRGVQTVEVRPQVSGTITEICVGEGARVKRGQTMFVIDQVPYKAALQNATAQVNAAKAQLANAELTLKGKLALREKNVVSDFEVEQAQNDVNQLRAALQDAEATELSARNNLSYTTVKSPADGVTGMMPYRVGALVGPSMAEPLATVADNQQIHAYFSITETEMQRLTAEHGSLAKAIEAMPKVMLRLADDKEYEAKGTVDAISGNVDAATGAVALRATFSNARQTLSNGGTGTIIMPYEMNDVVVIPQEATYELQDKHFVYKVVEGKTKSTEIKVSDYDNGSLFIVTHGLKQGDVIIAEGAGLLHDGIIVK